MAKDLKSSTRKLCRQLQDNPDVTGNQILIKQYKKKLEHDLADLMELMNENQSFSSFKQLIDNEVKQMKMFDNLKEEEKNLTNEIKDINEKFKKFQDEWAQEAQEQQEEIQLKKSKCNEAKTERELMVKYKDQEIQGRYACHRRLYEYKETVLRDKITQFTENIKIEQQVSEKIQDFIKKKTERVSKDQADRDEKGEKEKEKMEETREEIRVHKDRVEKETDHFRKKIDDLDEEKRIQMARDEEEANRQAARVQEKLEMEAAARYVQDKWKWYNENKKNFAKTKKKKGKGKKKKK